MAKDGHIRAALAIVQGAPLDMATRGRDLLRSMRAAEDAGARLLLFPLHSLMGADAGDMAMGPEPQSLYLALRDLARHSGECLTALPLPYPRGGRLYPAIALMRRGRLRHVMLADAVWDDAAGRPFRPRMQWHLNGLRMDAPFFVSRQPLIPLKGLRLGFMLGRDMAQCRRLKRRGADVLVMPDAQPAQALWHPSQYLQALSYSLDCGILYANLGEGESSMDAVYGGERLALHRGHSLAALPAFSGQPLLVCDMDGRAPRATQPPPALPLADSRLPYAPVAGPARALWCQQAMAIMARGLALRMQRSGSQTLILGLSGGLDSAIALLTSAEALRLLGLPQDRLMAWSLPCFGTSGRTRGNALRLMQALHLPERELDISEAVTQHLAAIGHKGAHDAAYENAQARERTQVLMDLCNMHRGLMVGPGDMSELALGFTTYGGDHMSMYGVNAGLYKTAIRLILRHVADSTDNRALAAALQDILATPISPELLPGGQHSQQTEALLGSYEVNDFILYHVLEGRGISAIWEALQAIFGGEYSRDMLKERMAHFFRRFFANQFKRSCLPDGPQVLGHSLSPRQGFRLPSDASAASWLAAIDNL